LINYEKRKRGRTTTLPSKKQKQSPNSIPKKTPHNAQPKQHRTYYSRKKEVKQIAREERVAP